MWLSGSEHVSISEALDPMHSQTGKTSSSLVHGSEAWCLEFSLWDPHEGRGRRKPNSHQVVLRPSYALPPLPKRSLVVSVHVAGFSQHSLFPQWFLIRFLIGQ